VEGDEEQAVEVSGVRASVLGGTACGRFSITLELLNRTAAASKDDDALANAAWVSARVGRAASGDINAIALVLEGTDGKARPEVESSADEFEIAPVMLRAKPDAG
jgi:hypothetical protein